MKDTILLLDENGDEVEFEVSATFGLDESKYAVLFPIDHVEGDAFILKIEYDDKGEMILTGIDDEQELEDVIFTYETFIKEENE
ncbi:DUF1292 domain-containing protein [Anaerosalibacter sp. Marseille-P3206]|uniref:DUF1292 domain-containing protein n=1 Tax=Anaerosalibacter sp. Marseille-P3206 TaxID=1871005 RepID=UPI0009869C5E|nr:DUF1292 domain-containing protein [Anaerosalibacter sp. Marseille-P3206]